MVNQVLVPNTDIGSLVSRVEDGRVFSQGELLDVIALADSFKRFEERKVDGSVLDAVGKQLISEEGYSVQTMYATAQELGIPREYVARAMEVRFPSKEKQFEDIKDSGAFPSTDSVLGMYEDRLLTQLRQTLPMKKFGSKGDKYYHFYLHEITESLKEPIFLKWREPKVVYKNNNLASFNLGGLGGKYRHTLEVEVYDPLFLHVCGGKLQELNTYFNGCRSEYNIVYHYVVK